MKWYDSPRHKNVKYSIIHHLDNYGLIRNDGEVILAPIFQKIECIDERCLGKLGIEFEITDNRYENGCTIYPDTYGEGLVAMHTIDTFEETFVDSKNNIVIDLKKFKFATIKEGFSKGQATIICNGNSYGYYMVTIDKCGNVLKQVYRTKPVVPIAIDHYWLNEDNPDY